MISQDIDLVAGDFNGAARRCRSRDNPSYVDDGLLLIVLSRRRALPLWGPDPSRTTGLMSVVFANSPVLNVSGKLANMSLFQYFGKLSA